MLHRHELLRVWFRIWSSYIPAAVYAARVKLCTQYMRVVYMWAVHVE